MSQGAIVIGGASGIGRAAAQALRQAGYELYVADQDLAGAHEVAQQVEGSASSVDVTDERSVESLFATVASSGVPIKAVVNTAGIGSLSLIVDHDVAEWRRVSDVNLTGTLITLKHAARAVADGGSIVSLTSLNARQAAVGMSAYCASKAGQTMLLQVAALELASRRVRVNGIAPGLVMTPMSEPLQTVPGVTDEYLDNTPIGRAGTPQEVAAAVVYLCSDQAAWITGEILNINGGAHLKRYPDLLRHIGAALT